MDAQHTHVDESVLLCPGCTGQWAVETASGSFYVLDLDAMTQTRVPDRARVEEWLAAGRTRPVVAPMAFAQTAAMRRDAEAVPLLILEPVRLGDPLVMWLNVVGDGLHLTGRRTNPVVAVRALREEST